MIDFLFGVFSSTYYVGTFLSLFTLIFFSSLGNCFSLRSGFYNIGGEGQIYLGGFVASLCLSNFSSLPFYVNFIFSFIVTILITGFFSALASFVNDYKKVSVLLASYIFSAALIPILDSLISGVFRGKTGNLLATDFIPENIRLISILPPSSLNAFIFVVPLFCIFSCYVFFNTRYGFELDLWGKAEEFSKFSGLSYRKVLYSSMFIDGALHGMTGFVAIVGQYYTCHVGFVAGLGWNALTCALLAKKNPVLLIPSALFLSWLLTSVSRFSLMNNLGFDFSGILQGTIIFIIAGKSFFAKIFYMFTEFKRKKWN